MQILLEKNTLQKCRYYFNAFFKENGCCRSARMECVFNISNCIFKRKKDTWILAVSSSTPSTSQGAHNLFVSANQLGLGKLPAIALGNRRVTYDLRGLSMSFCSMDNEGHHDMDLLNLTSRWQRAYPSTNASTSSGRPITKMSSPYVKKVAESA